MIKNQLIYLIIIYRHGLFANRGDCVTKIGGRGEIRTHGGYEPTSVFKTGALNRSATLPETEILS